jgi:hypothetical protein
LPLAGLIPFSLDSFAGKFDGHAQFAGRGLHELAHRMLLARGDDVIVGRVLLQHEPLHLHVVLGMPPVAQGVQVAKIQAVLQAKENPGHGAGDLAGDKGLAAQGRLVVEEDAVAGIHAVGLAVVDRDPVGVELGAGIGRARVEGRLLGLGDFLHQAVQLGGGRLVKARLLLQAQNADGLQHAQRPQGVDVGRVFRRLEGDLHVGLGGQIVDLVRLDLLDDADQVGRVGQVPVVQEKPATLLVRVLVEVIHAIRVEERGPALDAVHLVPLGQQKLGQIGPVLTGDAGDEGFFGGILSASFTSTSAPPAAKSSGLNGIGSMLLFIFLRSGTIFRLSMKRSPVKNEETKATSTSLSSLAVPFAQEPNNSALSTEIPFSRRTAMYFLIS